MNMLNIAKSVHSLSDFKRNDPDLAAELEETGGPIILTVNGKAKYVVQDAESYQQMLEALEDAKTMQAILEMKAGKGRPATQFFAELGKELGIKTKKKR